MSGRAKTVLTPVLPMQSQQPAMVTASPYMLRARHEQFPATVQSTYDKNNNRIRVSISSQDSFADLRNSYFRCKVATKLLYGTGVDSSRRFQRAGILSLFERVHVQTTSNAHILDSTKSSMLAAMLKKVGLTSDSIDSFGEVSGASEANAFRENVNSTKLYTEGGGNYTVADKKLLITVASTDNNFVVAGDIVHFCTNAGNTFSGVVAGVVRSSATALDLYLSDISGQGTRLPTADLTATTVSVERYQKPLAANQLACAPVGVTETAAIVDGDYTTITFNLAEPFFQQKQWFPLFLLNGGINIDLYLKTSPELAIKSSLAPIIGQTFSGAAIYVKDIYYVCRLVQASDTLKASYLNLFDTDGIRMRFTSFTHKSDIKSKGASNYVGIHSPGKRGVKFLLANIQDERHNTPGTQDVAFPIINSATSDSDGEYLRAGLNEYSFRALSLRYPLDSAIDISNDNMMNEPLQILQNTVSVPISKMNIYPDEWRSTLLEVDQQESKSLILSTLFAKTHDANTGMDFNNTSIQVEYAMAPHAVNITAIKNRYFNFFFAHDVLLHFHKSHQVVVFS